MSSENNSDSLSGETWISFKQFVTIDGEDTKFNLQMLEMLKLFNFIYEQQNVIMLLKRFWVKIFQQLQQFIKTSDNIVNK